MVQLIIINEREVMAGQTMRVVCDVYEVSDGNPPEEIPITGCQGIFKEDAEKFLRNNLKARLAGI